MIFFPKRYARNVFHYELIEPYGCLMHEDLLRSFEEEVFAGDPDYQKGTLFQDPFVHQILNVFGYIFMLSLEIADRNGIPPENWISLAGEFLSKKYGRLMGPQLFERTFSDAYTIACQDWEQLLRRGESEDLFDAAQIQKAAVEFKDRQQYKILNCADCQDANTCKREKPEDCSFINAVQKEVGAENRIQAPVIFNGQVRMQIKPEVLGNKIMETKLNGIWNYYCANKQRQT